MQTTAPVDFHFLEPANLKDRLMLKAFLRSLFKREGTKLESLRYIFCSDKYLLEINRQYLNHDDYTDIITFNLSNHPAPVMGEIYISIDRVRDNAQQFHTSFKEELHRVIFHGALHLCGYKDKTSKDARLMREKEDESIARYRKYQQRLM
ncbi:rRNA maturation RNase YbeY [Paraflavitalea soli]|uniref:Endoribonuclease YbeY n=1 Tax=Paraflavitalea soli TaxID=2315862 RepID=A0A3B7MRB0_9BACT|nr:rRNA maturation RNase YbeY [Paraflavitalea soli]AXY76688.1 rRNA maturation RNase YbeY [Paraflavitalea soli]